MENEKYILRQKTLRRYILAMAHRGAAGIITDRGYRKRYLIMVALITLGILILILPYYSGNPLWQLVPGLMYTAWTAIWLILCLAAVPVCGYIPRSWTIYDDLTRAGIVNFAGEAPLLIACQNGDHNILKCTFQIKGYPISRWQENQSLLESALNVSILGIHQGEDNQTIEIEAVKASSAFNHLVPWLDALLPDLSTELSVGVNAAGIPLIIDLAKVPHWLIGAATGCGKTQLLLLLIHQFHLHNYIIYLADFKGVDYPAEYQVEGHYATETPQLLDMLSSISAELTHRRNLLTDSGCNHLDVYNSTHDVKLRRIVVVLDETSMILDTTGRTKEEKAEIAEILNHLLTLGRLGRAMGIHLIVATQRPDVASVPGALKAQLDGRICGHCADAQSSIVILDDASGAKLPAIPGRFIIRDGNGCDKIIQAFLLNN